MRNEHEARASQLSNAALGRRVRPDHPLRVLRDAANIALREMSEELDALLPPAERGAIPREQLLRALLLEAFYSIPSESLLLKRIDLNLLFRWFVEKGTDDPAWDIATFTSDRLLAGDAAGRLLDIVVTQPEVRALLSAGYFPAGKALLEAQPGTKRFLPENGLGPPRSGEQDLRDPMRSNDLEARLPPLSAQLVQAEQSRDAGLASPAWRSTRPVRWATERMPAPLRRHGRRALKAAWWVVTPWLMPQRIRFLRSRHRNLALQGPEPELGVPRQIPLNLFDSLEVQKACGLPNGAISWPPQDAQQISDTWSAIRWIIDLLKLRPDLRQRFPCALADGADGAFARWLASEGGDGLGVSRAAKACIAEAFVSDPGARARQYYFWRDDLRVAMPLGLLPPGRHDLAAWMLRHRDEGDLKLEEVWWLLLQSAEDPAAELVQTYLFTPAWQEAHPCGLTPFGCDRLAAWINAHYGLGGEADWLDPQRWPIRTPPDEQLRLVYAAREGWREAHPVAFENEQSARNFLAWLTAEFSGASSALQDWCASRLIDDTAKRLSASGANIIGHFCYPSGLRVSVEAAADAIELAGGRVARRDMRTSSRDDPHHAKYGGLEPYDITIIHTQPEPFFDRSYALSDLHQRVPQTYRIAYWYWELETAPDHWVKTALSVDEVWTATRFVADALHAISPVPVRTMFPGVTIGSFTPRSRQAFGLPGQEGGRFAFLFSFHMGSVMRRKNPLSLIQAFSQAFHPEEPVDLILKTTSFGHDAQVAELRQAAAGANISVLDAILTPDETLSLIDACDAYVSLHRSEGLGLTMAEAMLLGKPVIATRYSGNLDFMDDRNSLLVDYKLVPVGPGVPPYDAEASWAEPSIEEAARLMRRVYDNQAWARELGLLAKHDARERLSLATAGKRIVERLSEIKQTKYRRTDVGHGGSPPQSADT